MRKIITTFLAVVLLISLCSFGVTAYAHPGSTDADGGHYDHSTGEYHYHHGYPAHDHYDIDGDGTIDCPYDFDDNTDHGVANSKTDSGDSSNKTEPETTASTQNGLPAAMFCGVLLVIFVLINGAAATLRSFFKPTDESEQHCFTSKLLSTLSVLIPFVILSCVFFCISGPINIGIVTIEDILWSIIGALGLSFAIATILWLPSLWVTTAFEKIFKIQVPVPPYSSAYSLSFILCAIYFILTL